MRLVVDSSVLVDYLRTLSEESLFFSLLDKELVLSLVTIGELYSGESAARQEKEIGEILAFVQVESLDADLMKEAGEIRRETKISLLDAIIAATALRLNLPVATLNTKDFEKVKDLKIYGSN